MAETPPDVTPSWMSPQYWRSAAHSIRSSTVTSAAQFSDTATDTSKETPVKADHRRRRSLPLRRADFDAIFQNPYSSVRGLNYQQPSSLAAVRNLLSVVSSPNEDQVGEEIEDSPEDVNGDDDTEDSNDKLTDLYFHQDVDETESAPLMELSRSRSEDRATSVGTVSLKRVSMTPTATASQLAEGTLRALRDLALDEAVALNAALHYWTRRWERPFLGWLEAGPFGERFDHLVYVGRFATVLQSC